MDWLQALITVAFGAAAGGITNSVAIWMLFHPYEPPRIAGRQVRGLQGAIPKNKSRLAAKIGGMVGNQLLTPADLARTVREPAFRSAFDRRLSAFLANVLERERGSLAEELPAEVVAELEPILDDVVESLVDRLDDYIAGDAFRDATIRRLEAFADDLGPREVGDVLTPEREASLTRTVDGWVSDVVSGEGFESAIHDYLDQASERLLRPGRTFEDILPQGLVAGFERAVAGYLPLALERLSHLLEDPAARERVEKIIHEILDRFMRDLRFHKRLVAALVITPETIDRILLAIEAEGAEKLADLLHEPAVRDAMARGVNDAVVEFLRRPASDVIGRAGEESVEDAKDTAADWLVGLARDPQTRGFVLDRIHATLGAAERRTWNDVFDRLPPDRIAELLVRAARSEEARPVYREAISGAAKGLLRRPIGRPADHLPEDAPERLEKAIAEPLWEWLQEQVPTLAERVDVAGRVEQKIKGYPTARLEELIRGVTRRELRLIVRLGYVLGAVVGLALVGLNTVM